MFVTGERRWCRCCRRRRELDDSDSEMENEIRHEKHRRSLACRICKWTSIVFLVLVVLLFIFVFVVVPIIFKESIEIQRKLMFPNFDQPENPQYENFSLYDIEGVRNFYVSVTDLHDSKNQVSLGTWQVVPFDQINDSRHSDFDYVRALRNSQKPIVIYFHGNSGTRIFPHRTYEVLRHYFHVIAWDYRSYGDSSTALLTEKAVVNDAIQFYQKIRSMTDQEDVYIWGHSLGTALSTHTLKQIFSNKKIVPPKALVLEAPFTTMREEVKYHPFGKIFAWLPWFTATIQDPLEDNGFLFRTTTNILDVDCPIMIIHAEDDEVIPYFLGEKLYNIATKARDIRKQGKLTFHLIPAIARSNHMEINKYPHLPEFIEKFLADIHDWYEKKNNDRLDKSRY